jgi:predicted enzyme related to lactoylglutathione lyase
MRSNPVRWFEIYVQDMARARAFYETVFDAKFERMGAGDLEMWAFPQARGEPGTAGALVRAQGVPSGGTGTVVYFGCEDCSEEAKRVVPAGGRLHRDKFSIGQYGFAALAYDTEGNLFGLHSLK